jgi:hypothetical protein
MPYKIDPKNKKCVIKVDTGKKVGCAKGSVKKYLAALHANIKESEEFNPEDFDWAKEISSSLELGFDDLKIGDVVKLKGYNPNDWEVVDIYMTASYMTGKPSEKRIKFKRIKGNPYGNSYLELWKSPLNSENYFELVNRNIKESKEFGWAEDAINSLPNPDDLNNHIVLYATIEDTLKNTNFKIVKQGDVYHIEDEYGDIYIYISEIDFNLPFIYHEIKDSIQFLKYEDDNEMLPYYQKLMSLLNPLYKNNINKLFKPIKESEEFNPEDFGWAEEIVKNDVIDITGSSSLRSLPQRSLLTITGVYEGMIFSEEKAVIIRKEDAPYTNSLATYLVKFDDVIEGDDGTTHCGENKFDTSKCDCIRTRTDYEDDLGKCWWVNLEKMDEVLLNFHEENNQLSESEDDWFSDAISDITSSEVYTYQSEINDLLQGSEYTLQTKTNPDNVIIFKILKDNLTMDAWSEKYFTPKIIHEDLLAQIDSTPEEYSGDLETLYKLLIPFFKKYNLEIDDLLNESEDIEWYRDVVNEPIMLKVEDLEMGDIVIPTCLKEGEYIVNGKGTSVKLLHEPTHWVTLKRNTTANTGGVFIEHDTETGKNCRFKLVHRENMIEESEEDYDWTKEIIESASIFDYSGKEIMIDISDLDEEEINQVIEIIKPYILHFDATNWSWFRNDEGESISWKNDCLKSAVGWYKKTISLHCGIEENDNKPLKGAVCCLSTGYHDEPEEVKDKIINVDIKPFLTPKKLEESEKKPLLNEGRYDAITRRVVRDIMKVLTNNPEGGDYDLPYDLDENEHEYQQLGLGFSLEVQIIRTDEMEDDFYIDASTSDDNEYENIMLMTIFLNNNFSEKNYQKLFYKLQEVVRHEIEHFTQQGTYRIEDRPIYKGNTVNLKTVYGHHKNVIEVPALVRGFYRRAKLERKDLDVIMREDLKDEVSKGSLTQKQADNLLKIWIDYAKKHLPKATYSKN